MGIRTKKVGITGKYATRYGLDALGYAIREMARNNEIHFTQKQMCDLWEYGGNVE